LHENKVLAFKAEDPSSRLNYVFVPGGRIESGETPEQAAVRETFEETGYRISILKLPSFERHYDFEWDGQINHCETIFLAGELLSEAAEPVDDAHYHRGVVWIPVGDLTSVFGYHPDILEPVLFLSRLQTGSVSHLEI
jgi:8-oxo-dGTP pyrophosphatase MutT (NUDIX family)